VASWKLRLRGGKREALLCSLLLRRLQIGQRIGCLLHRTDHRRVVIGHRFIEAGGRVGIIRAQLAGIEDRQVNRGAEPILPRRSGEQRTEAQRGKAGEADEVEYRDRTH